MPRRELDLCLPYKLAYVARTCASRDASTGKTKYGSVQKSALYGIYVSLLGDDVSQLSSVAHDPRILSQ